jgi:hypothetical protein
MDSEGNDNMTLSRGACLDFETDLVAYLEGEHTPALLAHAKKCEFCGCLLADLQQIRDIGSEFELESPPAAVWPRVREALVREGIIKRPNRFWSRWLERRKVRLLRNPVPLGALAAAAIAAVILLTSPGNRTRPTDSQQPSVNATLVPEFVAPTDVAQLKSTVQQLEVAYHANELQLEPSIKATYEKSLASLNDEIRECEDSVEQDPHNGLAREYLSTAYVQKAQLLQSALEFNLR